MYGNKNGSRNPRRILHNFAYFGYFSRDLMKIITEKIQDGRKIEHGFCLHLFCWSFYYVYRDTIAAPGPVSLLSYVEKLITAVTREGMSYGDTKSRAD